MPGLQAFFSKTRDRFYLSFITPTYRKPFSLFAKRASRPNWLPEHRRNPNFSVELLLGLTNAKSRNRWAVVY